MRLCPSSYLLSSSWWFFVVVGFGFVCLIVFEYWTKNFTHIKIVIDKATSLLLVLLHFEREKQKLKFVNLENGNTVLKRGEKKKKVGTKYEKKKKTEKCEQRITEIGVENYWWVWNKFIRNKWKIEKIADDLCWLLKMHQLFKNPFMHAGRSIKCAWGLVNTHSTCTSIFGALEMENHQYYSCFDRLSIENWGKATYLLFVVVSIHFSNLPFKHLITIHRSHRIDNNKPKQKWNPILIYSFWIFWNIPNWSELIQNMKHSI